MALNLDQEALKAKANLIAQAISAEAQMTISVIKEKGGKRFLRPVVLGTVFAFMAYFLAYAAPLKKMAALQNKIDAAKASADYAEEYKTLRARLSAVYAKFPLTKDRESWMTEATIQFFREQNLISDFINPPEEGKAAGFYVQKMATSVQMRFPELMTWVLRVEKNKPMLRVLSIDITKKGDVIGMNAVSCTLQTLIPEARYQ